MYKRQQQTDAESGHVPWGLMQVLRDNLRAVKPRSSGGKNKPTHFDVYLEISKSKHREMTGW